jgi:hypothetical protein
MGVSCARVALQATRPSKAIGRRCLVTVVSRIDVVKIGCLPTQFGFRTFRKAKSARFCVCSRPLADTGKPRFCSWRPAPLRVKALPALPDIGLQVFSGTALGSKPVLIYDDEFRFDVNLAPGATTGSVFFTERIAGPRIKCELEIVGTGFTPEGDGLANYSGRCKMRTNK